MPRGRKYIPTELGKAVYSADDPDLVDLQEALRIMRCSRSTFFRTDVPRFRVKGRLRTSRAACEAAARQRGVAL